MENFNKKLDINSNLLYHMNVLISLNMSIFDLYSVTQRMRPLYNKILTIRPIMTTVPFFFYDRVILSRAKIVSKTLTL